MSVLSRQTIQSLAVLRAISEWSNGAYGPVRIHKTLFFADKANDPQWRLFKFKRWYLGQYSDSIAETLNILQRVGRIRSKYDGPSERIIANLSSTGKQALREFFDEYFPDWSNAFVLAFKKWAYMTNDTIIRKSHGDPTYTASKHGEEIFDAEVPYLVEFQGLPDEHAERLSDLVDARLTDELSSRLNCVVQRKVVMEDWRTIYFNGED